MIRKCTDSIRVAQTEDQKMYRFDRVAQTDDQKMYRFNRVGSD